MNELFDYLTLKTVNHLLLLSLWNIDLTMFWTCNRIRLIAENGSVLCYALVCLPGVVNCPTRWSLLFVFGLLCWSSSWRWQPHIGTCRLFWPLLRAGMAVLTQFFCKMYFLYVSRSQKKNLGNFFLVLPPEKAVFFWRGSDFQEFGAISRNSVSTLFSNAPLYWMFRDQ